MCLESRFLDAPTLVVFGLGMMVVVMVFGLYLGFFGIFSHS